LNFVRLCIEASLSLRTPGETLLISREDQPDPAFLRTHDAAGVLGKENQGVWRVITQNKAESAKVVLLLRNPLDVFGRAKATGRPSSSLRVFCHNINQFVKIKPKDKRCFYFEDFISAPKKNVGDNTFLASKILREYRRNKKRTLRKMGVFAKHRKISVRQGSSSCRRGYEPQIS